MCLAIPGRLLTITGEDDLSRMGTVDFNGVRRDVALAGVPGVKVGEYVIVHAGFALSVLDEAEAQATLDLLRQISQVSGDPTP